MTAGTPDHLERLKGLIDKAISTGRAFQSFQTGYVHYYHSMPMPAIHQTIPLYENCLFILALLRSRLVENINEAKELLVRLLSFQQREAGINEGNFPYYLQDYPHCYDAENGVRLIAPLYWMLKKFGHVLGHDLKEALEKGLSSLIHYGIRAHANHPFPYSLAVRLAAGLQACGAELKQMEWQQAGKEQLRALAVPSDSWYATNYLADLFAALQMAEGCEEEWKPFWRFIDRTWHRHLCCYIGPCVREWQSKEEPQLNAYDLFMNFFYGGGRRISQAGIYQLQAALIQPFLPPLGSPAIPYQEEGFYKGQKWLLSCQQELAYTLLEKKGAAGPVGEKTLTPFRFVWANSERLHTMVCQGGKYAQATYKEDKLGQTIELFFHLGEEMEREERDKQRDICFYWDDHSAVQIRIEGQAATTFELNQPVDLQMGPHQALSLSFELVEGEGQFLGHIAKGNRPSQLKLMSEEKSFQAYDGLLFIRTVRRQTACCIKATLRLIQPAIPT